ncbi:MMPL family transporter, partial [Rhodococcus sp. NPDC059234]|uniref:MMPL family transporter n=1 Tax=Rhodococcus sp. NPDC059234 TaxID=3346781 RepID=UPI00366A8522
MGINEGESIVSNRNVATADRPPSPAPKPGAPRAEFGGILGRLGAAMAGRARWVFGVWLIALVALGAAAPSVFSSLAGAGWQASGSESVQVRELAQEHFGGNSSAAVQVVVHSDTKPVSDPAVQQVLGEATALFRADPRFGEVIAPQPGMSISPDGHTGILIAGANASTDDMVKAVDELKGELTALAGDGVEVYPTGASALWSDFNKANHDAMIQAEMFS